MKYLIFAIFLGSSLAGLSQPEKFGLLQFNIPAGWQQQSRNGQVSFRDYNRETNVFFEIKTFDPISAAAKPDSSFRLGWKLILDSNYGNPPLPPVLKRRFTPSGISYFEAGGTCNYQGSKPYVTLLVFNLDARIQPMILMTNDAATFKGYREFIADFMDHIDLAGTKTKNR